MKIIKPLFYFSTLLFVDNQDAISNYSATYINSPDVNGRVNTIVEKATPRTEFNGYIISKILDENFIFVTYLFGKRNERFRCYL